MAALPDVPREPLLVRAFGGNLHGRALHGRALHRLDPCDPDLRDRNLPSRGLPMLWRNANAAKLFRVLFDLRVFGLAGLFVRRSPCYRASTLPVHCGVFAMSERILCCASGKRTVQQAMSCMDCLPPPTLEGKHLSSQGWA
jgi:hypothetical protein